MNPSHPRIGFDRYVHADWCHEALRVAAGLSTLENLNQLVGQTLTGVESRRKTVDILKRLWISPYAHSTDFVARGVDLFKKQGDQATVKALNWGVAIATYPFFGKVSEITGRLFSLHDECTMNEIQRRMAETYGDRDGISRAVARVLQSQESWLVFNREEKGKRMLKGNTQTVMNEMLIAWLLEAALRYAKKPLSISMLESMPLLYPFVLDGNQSNLQSALAQRLIALRLMSEVNHEF